MLLRCHKCEKHECDERRCGVALLIMFLFRVMLLLSLAIVVFWFFFAFMIDLCEDCIAGGQDLPHFLKSLFMRYFVVLFQFANECLVSKQ